MIRLVIWNPDLLEWQCDIDNYNKTNTQNHTTAPNAKPKYAVINGNRIKNANYVPIMRQKYHNAILLLQHLRIRYAPYKWPTCKCHLLPKKQDIEYMETYKNPRGNYKIS